MFYEILNTTRPFTCIDVWCLLFASDFDLSFIQSELPRPIKIGFVELGEEFRLSFTITD